MDRCAVLGCNKKPNNLITNVFQDKKTLRWLICADHVKDIDAKDVSTIISKLE